MNNTQQAGETAKGLFFTFEQLREMARVMEHRGWHEEAGEEDSAKFDTFVTDYFKSHFESHTADPVEAKADEKNLRNGIIHLREWLQNHRFLTAGYGAPISMIDEMLRGDLPYAEPTPTSHAEGEKGAVGFAEWIPASNPPKECGRYWCYLEEVNDLGISHFQWNVSYSTLHGFQPKDGGRVTHWMELQPPPKK